MRRLVGIELGLETLRVVEFARWSGKVARKFEVAWSANDPTSAVATLRRELAQPDGLAIAVGLGFLRIARVELPPVSDEQRDQMVGLEPERFFTSRDEVLAAVAPGTSLAFAASRSWLESVVRAFNGWTPVERVETAPVAATNSLGSVTGTYALAASVPDEEGILVLREGAIQSVRRSRPSEEVFNAPVRGAVEMRYAAAHGAVLGLENPVAGTLMSEAARRVVRRRTLSRQVLAASAAAACLAFMLWSIDQSRERTLVALEARATQLLSEVEPALRAQAQLVSIEGERSLISGVLSQRPDAAAGLAAISALLPRDAVLMTARFSGGQWQITGTADDAAALVPRFDADARFDSVRVLAASSRFRDGQRARETFSLAFHVR